MRRPLLLQTALVFAGALALWQAWAPEGSAAEPSCCGPISSQGRRLEAVLDGMNVESLWLAHEHIGVYMLRPPEHGQILLANAQAEWFRATGGKGNGWREVRTAREAQSLANQGNLVVVVYESPDPHKPGHVAIIRPAHRLERLLEQNGPEIIQAGQKNYLKTSAKVGYQAHPGAWPDGVRYYSHSIER
jgi:hypothetical protein